MASSTAVKTSGRAAKAPQSPVRAGVGGIVMTVAISPE